MICGQAPRGMSWPMPRTSTSLAPGMARAVAFPPEGEAVFVCMSRDGVELGVVHESSPQQLISQSMGDGPRFELFVYVDDVEAEVEVFRAAGHSVLQEPATMPWGERQAYLADPEGNPVALATPV